MIIYNDIDHMIEELGDSYDEDAIRADWENGNIDLNDVSTTEAYYKPYIVAESITNGQIKQARDQYNRYGLTPAVMVEYITINQLDLLLNRSK